MKVKAAGVALFSLLWILIAGAPLQGAPESALRKQGTFALGGVGVAGVMSQGERTLREILKESDAAVRLESMLRDASPAGRLYALLGLRRRDRAAYERALEKYRANDAKVPTMRGCILQRESFHELVKQIERGEYDSFWPGNGLKRSTDFSV